MILSAHAEIIVSIENFMNSDIEKDLVHVEEQILNERKMKFDSVKNLRNRVKI